MTAPNKASSTIRTTRTEEVALPTNEPMSRVLGGRDWQKLKLLVDGLDAEKNYWHTAFTIFVSVFLSFLVPVIGTPGQILDIKLIYFSFTIVFAALSLVTLFAWLGERSRKVSSKRDLESLIAEVEALYVDVSNNLGKESDNLQDGEGGQFLFQDNLYDEAVRLAKSNGKISASLLQRRLKIGYSRAARIIADMEKNGIVSSSGGSAPREVLRPE